MNPALKTALIHIGLFLLTFTTATLAGVNLINGSVEGGILYAATFLFILSVHEFGHYFTALWHHIRTTFPYYIPLPPGFFLLGTMGAVIRIKDPISTKQIHFDIGIAGPLAGFVAAIGVLIYAFTHLPAPDYIFTIHPEYAQFGASYAAHVYAPGFSKGTDLVVGGNLIFWFFEKFVADPTRMPNAHEMIHYPLLIAGYFSLVFTALNLLPIGQLDGGHVLYGLVGYERHRKVASVIFVLLIFFAGLGFVSLSDQEEWYWKMPVTVGLMYYCFSGLKFSWQGTLILTLSLFVVQFGLGILAPALQGYPGWAIFLLLLRRVVGIEHPQAFIEEPLTRGRVWLGWLALLVFILCFTPAPLDSPGL